MGAPGIAVFYSVALLFSAVILIWEHDEYFEVFAGSNPLEGLAVIALIALLVGQYYLLFTADIKAWVARKKQFRNEANDHQST